MILMKTMKLIFLFGLVMINSSLLAAGAAGTSSGAGMGGTAAGTVSRTPASGAAGTTGGAGMGGTNAGGTSAPFGTGGTSAGAGAGGTSAANATLDNTGTSAESVNQQSTTIPANQ
jgi:hypothetical protein